MSRARFGFTALLAVVALVFLSPLRLDGQRASRFDREVVNGREVVAGEALVKFRYPLRLLISRRSLATPPQTM